VRRSELRVGGRMLKAKKTAPFSGLVLFVQALGLAVPAQKAPDLS
jgi:hypothetical protein